MKISRNRSERPRSVSERGRAIVPFWALGGAATLVWLLVVMLGPRIGLTLAFERGGVLAGEVWRLATHSLAHLSGAHLAWNLLALAALAVLLSDALDAGGWWRCFVAGSCVAGLGVLAFEPGVAAMLGLSALLHAVCAAGGLARAADRRGVGAAILLLLVAKLAWERGGGTLPGTADLFGDRIAVAAHLYGALGGAAAAVFELLRRKRA